MGVAIEAPERPAGVYPAMLRAVRSCLPVYRILLAHTPGHVVLVVGTVLASQLSILADRDMRNEAVFRLAG